MLVAFFILWQSVRMIPAIPRVVSYENGPKDIVFKTFHPQIHFKKIEFELVKDSTHTV